MKTEQKTACIAFADGCPRGMADAALVMEYFKANGWVITNDFRKASMSLISTCGGVDFAEEKSMMLVDIASRKMMKGSKLILFGCLPGISEKRLRDRYDAELLPPARMERLDGIIGADVRLADVRPPVDLDEFQVKFDKCYSWFERSVVRVELARRFPYKLRARLVSHVDPLCLGYGRMANIKVLSGCNGRCSYCAIRFGEGELCSKPLDKVMEEFHSALAEGYDVFRLIGGDVGGYGQDNGSDVCDLLRAVFDVPGEYKVFWDDFNPEWLIGNYPEIRKLLSENVHKIAHAGFPVQSGNKRILGLMNRNYTVAEAKWHITDLKAAVPDLALTSHAIIGFPTETESDFQDTLDMMAELRFGQVDVYKYSDRPGTEASAMSGKVTEKVKDKRLWRMCRMFPATCVIG